MPLRLFPSHDLKGYRITLPALALSKKKYTHVELLILLQQVSNEEREKKTTAPVGCSHVA